MILSAFLPVVCTIFTWAVCVKRYGAGEQPDVRIGDMNSSSWDLLVANSLTPTTGAAGHGAGRPYGRIGQRYDTLDQVKEALQEVGLESPNLIIGVDFTKSNEWTGPTSLAPIIETATRIVEDSGYQYHILLIIADGQVPRSTGAHFASYLEETRSENYLEERTLQALIHASHFPVSIVLVGVGDGPWDDVMHSHDNRRRFDNFQFVDFTKIMSREMPQDKKEEQFALEALMRIPTQYAAIISQRIRYVFAEA